MQEVKEDTESTAIGREETATAASSEGCFFPELETNDASDFVNNQQALLPASH